MQLVHALYGKNWYNETFGQLVQFLSYLENAHINTKPALESCKET